MQKFFSVLAALCLVFRCLFPLAVSAADQADPTEPEQVYSSRDGCIELSPEDYEKMVSGLIAAAKAPEQTKKSIFSYFLSDALEADAAGLPSLSDVTENTRFLPWPNLWDDFYLNDQVKDNAKTTYQKILDWIKEKLNADQTSTVVVPEITTLIGKQRIAYRNNTGVEIITVSITFKNGYYASPSAVNSFYWIVEREFLADYATNLVKATYTGTASRLNSYNVLDYGTAGNFAVWNGTELLTSQPSAYTRVTLKSLRASHRLLP